jgi:rubrerythrin
MMNREKQIEEMRKEVVRIHRFFFEDDDYESLDEYIADMLYAAGYRKQSEGEWKKVYDKAPRYVCMTCNHLYNNKGYKYCPNCGVKMKGGAE